MALQLGVANPTSGPREVSVVVVQGTKT